MKSNNIQTNVTRFLQKMRVRNASIIEGRSEEWIRRDVCLILDEIIERISIVQNIICGGVMASMAKLRKEGKKC